MSMVTPREGPAADTFPAESVTVAETAHSPSLRVARSQYVADPTAYEHETVTPSFSAEIVIVDPAEKLPVAANRGVLSFVMLSFDSEPESDTASRSTPDGADGAAVSTVTFNDADADDTTELNDWVALTLHVSSTKAPRSQEPLEPEAVNVHVTSVCPVFLAVTVTVAPDTSPVTEMLGVLSLVSSSEVDDPVSDDVVRSTAVGAGIATAAVAADTEVAVPFALVAVEPNLRK